MYVEVKGQLSLFRRVGPREQTQDVRFNDAHLYPLHWAVSLILADSIWIVSSPAGHKFPSLRPVILFAMVPSL